MIVAATYPAPVAFVPFRGRNERFAFASCAGPVELREDDLSRSVEVGPLFPEKTGLDAEPMRLLDGRLWMPVPARTYGEPSREATLDEFVSWMSGKGDPALEGDFRKRFDRTPLVASQPREGVTSIFSEIATRGEPTDVERSRDVRLDGRDKARADVARYLAEEIRILDGRPFMRCSPLLLVNGVTKGLTMDIDSRVWPHHAGMRTFPATPDTFDAIIETQAAMGVTQADAKSLERRRRWLDLIPAEALEGDDVRWIVNEFAGPVRRSLDDALQAAGFNRAKERLEAARLAIRAIEIPAMTGTAHWDGDAPVQVLRQSLATWLSRPNNGTHGQEFLAAYIDRVVLPRIDARSSGDLDAAGLLAP